MAQLTIPLPKIPITGQSLAVLLVGYSLRSQLGLLAVLLYLLMGAIGLPVFADGEAGIAKLWGASGGFLYGFAIAAYVIGLLAERNWDKSFPKSIAAMSIGTALILLFGVLHLSGHIGLEQALQYGFYPFIAGAIVKILIGAAIMPLYYKFIDD